MNGSHAKDIGYPTWPCIVEGEMIPEGRCYREGVESHWVKVIGYEKKDIMGEVAEFDDCGH